MTPLSDLLATGSEEAPAPAVPDDALPWPHRPPASSGPAATPVPEPAIEAASRVAGLPPMPALVPAAALPPVAEVPPTAPTRPGEDLLAAPVEDLMAPPVGDLSAPVEEISAPADLDDIQGLMVPRQYEELTRLDQLAVRSAPAGASVAGASVAGAPAAEVPAADPPARFDPADFFRPDDSGSPAPTDPFEGAEAVAPALSRWHRGDDDVVAAGAGRSAVRAPARSRIRLGRR